jgi:hypothetical protein
VRDYTDVLAQPRRRRQVPEVPAETELVVETADGEFCGAVVALGKAVDAGEKRDTVTLEDRRGKRRVFAMLPAAFLLDGQIVTLVRPAAPAPAKAGRTKTASGSYAVADAPARVARASRLWVEGVHDAALLERIWGDDLRIEGVVVELMDGVDDLAGIIADFQPGPGRRLGVLVDHLVPGTKEARIVDGARALPGLAAHVKILGHPYVDVWQSVRPERLGWQQWPVIPRGTSWKHGICAALGWPHDSQADIARAWKRILGTVRTYADLEPTLLASVEELIDFVTEPTS